MKNPKQTLKKKLSPDVSEIRYRRLFEASRDGILLIDPVTRKIFDANPQVTQLLGYARKELIGKELFEIGFSEDELASRKMFRRLKRNLGVRYENLPLEGKGGKIQEVEVVASLYPEGDRSVIQCNIRDITDRKHVELALSRLAAIVSFSDDAIIAKDTNGVITDWNKGAERLFGYTAGEIVGTSIMRLIPDDRREEEHRILARIKGGQRVEHFETVRKTKSGKPIEISVTVSPIKDSRGRIVGASKVVRDITLRKQQEESQRRVSVLTASNMKLEREIARREALEKSLLKSRLELEGLQGQTKRLAQQALRAQEDERLRISRELHDQVAQTLIGINVRLISLVREAGPPASPLHRRLKQVQGLLENSVETVHALSENLRPLLLDDLGLVSALRSVLKTFMTDTGIRASLAVSAKMDNVDNARLTVLYRVAQEALSNVKRHSKAHNVKVKIQKFADRVSMTIADDGAGCKGDAFLKAKQGKRLGLIGMRERLEMVGGAFEILCEAGKGATVTAQIPLQP